MELVRCLRDVFREWSAVGPQGSSAVQETPQDIAREMLREFDREEVPPDSDRATAVVDSEPEASPVPATVSPGEAATSRAPALRAEQLIASTHEREQNAQRAIERDLRAAARRERFLYVTLVVVAVITAGLAVVAASLLIEGHGSSAVASAAVALLPGVGTLLLRRLRRDERDRIAQLEDAQRKHATAVQAIEFALSLDEPQRSNEIGALIAEMRRVAYG
jgi:hypothetical protein